ncbi:MAG: hypothetical protein ACKVQK_27270 [Burkholderiales bacterium]
MMVFLLILHGLLAVALLGALTHQAIGAWIPQNKPADSFVARARGVSAPAYTGAISVLYILTAILGGIIYAEYRISARIAIEQLEYWAVSGTFELKEHFVAIGLGLLPAYAFYWRRPLDARHARTRAMLTLLLAFIVWWGFLVGHVVNNIRGFEW